MANFDGAATRLQSARDATNLLQLLRATYTTAKAVTAALALYQAGTDPIFNAWEANHPGAIGITG